MPTQSWDFTLEDKPHSVDLDVSFWTAAKTIYADGFMLDKEKVQSERRGLFVTIYTFSVAHHKCSLRIVNDFLGQYELRTGQELIEPQYPQTLLPGWAWIFIVGCLLTPACSLGGLIPLVLAVVGAYYSAAVARNAAERFLTRAATCAAIMIFCWATTFTIYIATH